MTETNSTASETSGPSSPKRPLEEGTADFRLLVDSIPDYAIFMLDLNGIVKSWNNGAKRIKGYDASEIIGRHFSIFYTEPDLIAEKPKMELEHVMKYGRYEEEGWRLRKDGTRFWANVVLSPLINEEGVHRGYGKVTRDLTNRMQAETILRESEEKFRLIISSVKDYAIVMLDPSGTIVSWNAGAERIKGWTEQEILGSNFERFYPPEDVAAGKTRLELEVATAVGSFEDYGWRIRKDGTRFWANVIITALKDESGKLRGFSKVTRDITDKKKAEDELQKAYEELESFSYSVSHDLRAPLRSMDGFSEILINTVGDKLDAKSKGYLNRIRESSQKMAKLIDDLLNLSRLSRTPLTKQTVNLSELADKIIGNLKKSEPLRQVQVVIEPHLSTQGDPILLQVILENLLGNAWKYTSKKDAAHIEFGMELRHGTRTFFVRDNGAGFDMAYKEKLFGAFQRLHGPTEFSGTGIGLAIVKRAVHRHGGHINAEGALEQGATFYFSLGT